MPYPQPNKTVAIVVPLHSRETLTDEEKLSLGHLNHYLERYDKFMVARDGLNINHPGFEIRRFDRKYFGSVDANKRLMFSPKFYEAFLDYEFILVHHLDVLVLSDQLLDWCAADFDYIGAPWLNCEDSPRVIVPRVGNGGFSLRKVRSFLKVLDSRKYPIEPDEYWAKYFAHQPRHIRYLNLPRKYLKHLRLFSNLKRELARYPHNEDRFWSDEATIYWKDFNVASFDTGLRFAFEAAPRRCFELTNHTLPFGCHAWAKYDREFWEPHLLK